MRMFRRLIVYCQWLAVCCLLVSGCGANDVEIVPVRGEVTFGGGEWPKPGVLYFAPVESRAGVPMRPGMARFGIDGRFSAATLSEGDGLFPGKYGIAVECWDIPPRMDCATRPKSCVPVRYQSAKTSGLEVTVEPGQREVELKLDVSKE